MGLFSLIGEVVSLPVKIVALPLDVAERVMTGESSKTLTQPLHDLAEAIEDECEELDDE